MSKMCSKCKETKELNQFSKDKQKKDGLYSQCRSCRSLDGKSEITRERDRARYPKRAEKLKSQLREKYSKNSQKYILRSEAYRNKNREKHNKCSLIWQKNNRDIANAIHAKYKETKKIQTPKWLTKSHILEIKEFYLLAKELQWLSEGRLEVDHIIPLQGENICGLNVPWNLQIIPKSLNAIKGNRIESVG